MAVSCTNNGPQAADLAKYKEAELLDYKKNMKENKAWLNSLVKTYTDGRNAEDMLSLDDKIKALTAKEVQEVAKKYLSKDKVIGILMPEKG